jgi:hypothetical protein
MTSKRTRGNRDRDWDLEFRVIEAHACGNGERVSREAVTEENKGFDSPPEWPPTR